jgi:hypothetical protein
MPSPIGHTLAGCAVALALIPPGISQAWEAWACCLISANLPDAAGDQTRDPAHWSRRHHSSACKYALLTASQGFTIKVILSEESYRGAACRVRYVNRSSRGIHYPHTAGSA